MQGCFFFGQNVFLFKHIQYLHGLLKYFTYNTLLTIIYLQCFTYNTLLALLTILYLQYFTCFTYNTLLTMYLLTGRGPGAQPG